MIEQSDFLTTKDVSRAFDKSESTIRLWVKLGKLRTIRGQNIFQRSDVQSLLDEQRGVVERS